MERFTRYDQICVEKLPLVKIRKNKPKSEISFKNRFRYQASSKIPKLWNLTHTPSHLVCNIQIIANVLSFHMSLVVVMYFGAGNALHGIEISMFWFY